MRGSSVHDSSAWKLQSAVSAFSELFKGEKVERYYKTPSGGHGYKEARHFYPELSMENGTLRYALPPAAQALIPLRGIRPGRARGKNAK